MLAEAQVTAETAENHSSISSSCKRHAQKLDQQWIQKRAGLNTIQFKLQILSSALGATKTMHASTRKHSQCRAWSWVSGGRRPIASGAVAAACTLPSPPIDRHVRLVSQSVSRPVTTVVSGLLRLAVPGSASTVPDYVSPVQVTTPLILTFAIRARRGAHAVIQPGRGPHTSPVLTTSSTCVSCRFLYSLRVCVDFYLCRSQSSVYWRSAF